MNTEYRQWMARVLSRSALRTELDALSQQEIHERFYQQLSFGTGGLRRLMGAGTNGKMQQIMHTLRTKPERLGLHILQTIDFEQDCTGLPKS